MTQCLSNPLGFRADGRPFWGFSGGEGEGDQGGGGDSGGAPQGQPAGGQQGGDADADVDPLQKALDAERGTVKKVRGELRGYKALLGQHGIRNADDLAAFLADAGGKQQSQQNSGQQNNQQGGQQSPPPIDADRLRREIQAEIETKAAKRVVLAKIEARATKTFADPGDAVLYLRDLTDDLLTDDNEPDAPAIDAALAELLKRKPHLGISKETPTDFEGGARHTAGAPASMDAFLRNASQKKRGG